jgi:hypothetical protein
MACFDALENENSEDIMPCRVLKSCIMSLTGNFGICPTVYSKVGLVL